jgi:predicted amidophosphoribosyltransferase
VKFLYKIHSAYDSFRPRVIPERASDQGLIELGWRRYFEEVEEEDEIWVYFHGGSFSPGVYIKGVAARKDDERESVWLQIHEYSTTDPLTDAETSAEIGQILSTRYRQVFFVPDGWRTVANCSLSTTASTCASRRCRDCATWKALPRVDPRVLLRPARMDTDTIAAFVPAFWAIPPRSPLWYEQARVIPGIQRTNGLFRRFKVGDARLAYPFALAMVEQLKRAGQAAVDAVIPIPLSPEKAENGELHRTKAIAEEISRLLRIRMVEFLSLSEPVGKRVLRRMGFTAREFERAYGKALVVDPRIRELSSILLVDDACTEGSTFERSAEAMLALNPVLRIVAASAVQMAVTAVLADQERLLVKKS